MPGDPSRTINDMCSLNERQRGGYFPVGKNQCWHSGMHVSTMSNFPVRPLIAGELAAHRINENYQTLPREAEISASAYAMLGDTARRLYHNPKQEEDDRKGTTEFRRYVLWKETLTAAERSNLKEEISPADYEALPENMRFFYKRYGEGYALQAEVLDLYRDDGGGDYIPVRELTTNFILLKHVCETPTKEIAFFTLYMGLRPGVLEAHKKYFNTFTGGILADEDRPFEKELPFYQTWGFKIIRANEVLYFAAENAEGRVTRGSHLEYSENSDDADNFECEFNNIQQGGPFIVNREYIEPTEAPRYVLRGDRASVFRRPIRDDPIGEGELFKIAELRQKHNGDLVGFRDSVSPFEGNVDFVEVGIYSREIHDDIREGNNYTWWYRGLSAENPANEPVPFSDSSRVFFVNTTVFFQEHYRIVPLDAFLIRYELDNRAHRHTVPLRSGGSIRGDSVVEYAPSLVRITPSADKRFVSLRFHHDTDRESLARTGTFSFPEGNPPMIIVGRGNLGPDIHLFEYNGERIEAAAFPNLDGIAVGIRDGVRVRSLETSVRFFCLSPVPEDKITVGEYLRLIQNENEIASEHRLPDVFWQGGNADFRPCRLALQPFGTGQNSRMYHALVRKSDLKVERGRGRLRPVAHDWHIDGLGSPASMEGVIAYDGPTSDSNARDIIPVGEEFELTNPSLINSSGKDAFFAVMWNGNTQHARFSGSELAAKVSYREGFGDNTNVIRLSESGQRRGIRFNDILGYPDTYYPLTNVFSYDLACFFVSREFMDDSDGAKNERTRRYLIQQDTELFRLKDTDGEEFEFERVAPGGTRPGVNELFRRVSDKRDSGGEKYLELRALSGSTVYVRSNQLDTVAGAVSTNLLDWHSHFMVLETGGEGGVSCKSVNEIVRLIEERDEAARVEIQRSPQLSGEVKVEDFLQIYNSESPRHGSYRAVRQAVRRLVCQHPLEWDASLYQTYWLSGMRPAVEKLDIWRDGGEEEISPAVEHKENSFWFAHPVQFINHLNEAGLLDETFNPYYRKEIYLREVGMNREERTQLVVDSPGFAPVAVNETRYKHNGISYSECTSLFNVLRSTGRRHTGIDLAPGGETTSIISFVYGEVWACTYEGDIRDNIENGGWGKIMIIKDAREDKLYFLAHLHDYVKEPDDPVFPGDIVAVCGQTGFSTGIHLHVEVRVIPSGLEKNDVLDSRRNKKNGEGAGLTWNRVVAGSDGTGPRRVNPFNHKEEHGGSWL